MITGGDRHVETRDQVRQATQGVRQGCVGGTRLDGGLYSMTHRLSSMARTPALLMLLKKEAGDVFADTA